MNSAPVKVLPSLAPSRNTLSPAMAAGRFSREMNWKSEARVTLPASASGSSATWKPRASSRRAWGLAWRPME